MASEYKDVLDYIDEYWGEARTPARRTRWGNARNLVMHIGRIKLPHQVISPNDEYFAGTQFYWDSYFTIIGLTASGRAALAKKMVDNLCRLYKRFGLVPARNSWTSLGRSQPPFLTRMAYEVYDAGAADDAWLNEVMTIAEQEYEQVWSGRPRLDEPSGLSRYRPRYLKRLLTVYESGWDTSSRFARGRTSVLPVDLNCLLFQYERDLRRWCEHRKDFEAARKWKARQQKRQAAINDYFWDDKRGFFFDFDLKNNERDRLMTVAGLFPLWCGAATPSQAEKCRRQVKVFEHRHGLAGTEQLPWRGRQWDYPNGWPPLQLIVVDGLRRYGFFEDAARISKKWLDLNQSVLARTGKLWEKYDVVNGDVGLSGRYPTQSGFAWTNGVFLKLLEYQSRRERQGSI